MQTITLCLYDSDTLSDDLLVEKTHKLKIPSGGFPGIIVPYEATLHLFKNADGYVAGSEGHSGETEAKVFHYLVEPGWQSNPSSEAKTIKIKE